MAAVRMSQRLRNEILSNCLLDWENANPKEKYQKETKRLFGKIVRKITPDLQNSTEWKLAEKFAKFVDENYAMFNGCMVAYNPNNETSNETVKDQLTDLIDTHNLEGFDTCKSFITELELNIIPKDEMEDYETRLQISIVGQEEKEEAIPFPIGFAIETPRQLGGSLSYYASSNRWDLGQRMDDYRRITHALKIKSVMSEKRYTKLLNLVKELENSRNARESDRNEYRLQIIRLLEVCTSVKQLLDHWPGADKYLPEETKIKLASKTTRSSNAARREEALTNIDIHELNKTAVKASM